jgi:hypothetical protein
MIFASITTKEKSSQLTLQLVAACFLSLSSLVVDFNRELLTCVKVYRGNQLKSNRRNKR